MTWHVNTTTHHTVIWSLFNRDLLVFGKVHEPSNDYRHVVHFALTPDQCAWMHSCSASVHYLMPYAVTTNMSSACLSRHRGLAFMEPSSCKGCLETDTSRAWLWIPVKCIWARNQEIRSEVIACSTNETDIIVLAEEVNSSFLSREDRETGISRSKIH